MIEILFTAASIGLLLYAIYDQLTLITRIERVTTARIDHAYQLKRRHDLIPKLVAAVEQYAGYERATLARVTALRGEAGRLRPAEGQGAVESDLSASLLSIFALQEAYPALKADRSFLDLQNDISEVEADIQYARRFYNGAVRNLNTRIDSFPDLIVARLFRFADLVRIFLLSLNL